MDLSCGVKHYWSQNPMDTSPTTATWWTSGHYQDESLGTKCNLLARNDKRHWVNDQQRQHLPMFSGKTVWLTAREAAYIWPPMADCDFRSFFFILMESNTWSWLTGTERCALWGKCLLLKQHQQPLPVRWRKYLLNMEYQTHWEVTMDPNMPVLHLLNLQKRGNFNTLHQILTTQLQMDLQNQWWRSLRQLSQKLSTVAKTLNLHFRTLQYTCRFSPTITSTTIVSTEVEK